MAGKPKVSILMPTYNDSKYLAIAIQSVLKQAYKNWKLIIIDDGSLDNTAEIVKHFEDDRIVFLQQEENKGQLNALIEGTRFICGNYITLLHSDDELLDKNALESNISLLENCDCDGAFSDLLKMDKNGVHYGIRKTANLVDFSSPAKLLLLSGSNIIPDIFFVKNEVFDNILSNYMYWNMPYWLKFNDARISILNLVKVRPWYKYRVYSENYALSEIGKFETLNGCLRTVVEIGQRIDLSFLKIQMLLARVLKTRSRPLFSHQQSTAKHLREMINYAVHRYFEKLPDNIYFRGLLGFYENFPSNRIIRPSFSENKIFLGKDARLFFKFMKEHSLGDSVYKHILEEAASGFGKVVVKDKNSYEKAKNLLKFLNLLSKVEIE